METNLHSIIFSFLFQNKRPPGACSTNRFIFIPTLISRAICLLLELLYTPVPTLNLTQLQTTHSQLQFVEGVPVVTRGPLLLSRCGRVPPHPPSSAMNLIINLSTRATRTSSSSSRVSSSCCPVYSASPTLGSPLYSPQVCVVS